MLLPEEKLHSTQTHQVEAWNAIHLSASGWVQPPPSQARVGFRQKYLTWSIFPPVLYCPFKAGLLHQQVASVCEVPYQHWPFSDLCRITHTKDVKDCFERQPNFFFLCLSPQILFFPGQVPCRVVQWKRVQEHFDQPQDAHGSHAWCRASSTQQPDQREALLSLPVSCKRQPVQYSLKYSMQRCTSYPLC